MKSIYEYLIGGKTVGKHNTEKCLDALRKGDKVYQYRCTSDFNFSESWELTVTDIDSKMIHLEFEDGDGVVLKCVDSPYYEVVDKDADPPYYFIYSVHELKNPKELKAAHKKIS